MFTGSSSSSSSMKSHFHTTAKLYGTRGRQEREMAFENLNESDDIEKLCEEIDAHQKEYDRKLLEEDSKF